MISLYLIIVLFTICAVIYRWTKMKLNYWKELGVVYPKPIIFFGNSLRIIMGNCSLSDICYEVYFKFGTEKLIGLFDFHTPTLIIKDPILLEKILAKDFQYFTDHSIDNRSGDLFSYSLFQMTGNRWKSVRHKISPTFTSGKIKMMFQQMLASSLDLIQQLGNSVGREYEIKNALSLYSLDIIIYSVFGMKFNKDNTKEEFIKMCSSIFNTSPLQFLNLSLLLHFPKLANKLGITFATKRIDTYFKNIIFDAFKQHSIDHKEKNDYVQLLMKLKEKGSIDVQARDADDSYVCSEEEQPIAVEITDDLLAGQVFQFLTAGLDPVFLCMTYTMYELAKYSEIQDRVRQEIKQVLAKNEGYKYEAIKEMNYLEQCIQESLRLHPIATLLFRQCTKTYTTEDGLRLEKGLKLVVPVSAIHMDPNYYLHPEMFNPDRFTPDTKPSNFLYLPFGNGPRMCIGFRFAMVVMKLGLARIIENFSFDLSPNTKPLEYNKLAFISVPTNKILFNLSRV